MTNEQPTRTRETETTYIDRAKRILRGIPESYIKNRDQGLHPVEIVEWLRDKAPSLRKNSFRQYKNALAYYMSAMSVIDPESAEDYRIGINQLKQLDSSVAAKRKALPDQTSSAKVKQVREADIPKLAQKMLAKSASKWGNRAFHWLIAGMGSGLRPTEWKNVKILEDSEKNGITIEVANAKNTNGRAGKPFRTTQVPPGWVSECTREHLYQLSEFTSNDGDFQSYYQNCRLALARAVRTVWPKDTRKHYSLYSGRHQFCANIKKSGRSLTEIARLMGHASTETATTHYGKKAYGHSSFAPTNTAPQPGENTPSMTK